MAPTNEPVNRVFDYRLFGNLKVIILFTGVIVPDYLIPKVISDYLSIAFRENLRIIVAKHVIILVIIRSLATPYAASSLAKGYDPFYSS